MNDRPRYADEATEALVRAGDDLDAVRLAITEVAAALRLWNVPATELTAAGHDIEDAASHLVTARRALVTSWSIGGQRTRVSIRVLVDGAETERLTDLALTDAHAMLDAFADDHAGLPRVQVERHGDHRVVVTFDDGRRRRELLLDGCTLHL